MTEQSDVPAVVIELEEIFHEHFEAVVASAGVLGSISGRLSAVTGRQVESIKSEVRVFDFLHHDVGDYVRRVKAVAAVALSAPLSPFEANELEVLVEEIDKVEEAARHSYDLDAHAMARRARPLLARCSPLKVWRALKAHHDPAAQNRVAATQQANTLGRTLAPHLFSPAYYRRGSQDPVEMKIVKGKVEVVLDVYTEKSWSSSKRTLSSSANVNDFAGGMDFALRQIHPDRAFVCGTRLMALCGDYRVNRRCVISRERIELGDGVHLVTGYQHFKLYLPQEVAAALNLFVAEYGTPSSE